MSQRTAILSLNDSYGRRRMFRLGLTGFGAASVACGLDPALRERVQPLTRPADGTDPSVVDAAREASTDAFRLAMLVAAGLLAAGAAVNGMGIQNPPRQGIHRPTSSTSSRRPPEPNGINWLGRAAFAGRCLADDPAAMAPAAVPPR